MVKLQQDCPMPTFYKSCDFVRTVLKPAHDVVVRVETHCWSFI